MAKTTKKALSRQSGNTTVVKSGRSTTGKPPKPYKDFPLTAHPSGHWAKKIRGKLHYFGPWGKRVDGKLQRIEGDGWREALDEYKAKADDLHAGRTPRVKSDGLTVRDVCNAFHTAKQRQRNAGEIAPRTFSEYEATTDRIVAAFGKDRLVDDLAADDFEALRADIAKKWGPVRLAGEIQKVRMVFRYGYEAGLIDRPVRYGPTFKAPSKRVMRKHRAKNGKKMMEAAELRTLIDAAPVQLRAMILLALNCGFGNNDCATLPLSAVDLDKGWIDYARPKTGIERRCPLWPETIDALREAIAQRTVPKDDAHDDLVFVTKYGGCWAKESSTANPISAEFRKLMQGVDEENAKAAKKKRKKAPVPIYRKGIGFYALRHVHRTIADSTRDFPACRMIMGHADASIDDVYREHIDDERLQAVVDHVRGWLFDGEGVDHG